MIGAEVYQWWELKSRRGKNKKLTTQRSNSNTFWFNFQTYILFSINLVSQVTLKYSGTNLLYGCHRLRCLYNIPYFLWLYNEFCIMWLYNELSWVRLLSNYNINYIFTIYTRLDTCLMSISRFSLRDKVTLRQLKLYFNIANVVEWSRALDIRLSDWCCRVSMAWVQMPSREEHKFDSSKI